MSQNMDNLLQDSTISISSSSITTSINSEGLAEVSSMDCELINMSEQEKDLINRMYRMVGDR
ncbi:hypothetical protein RchiOBHm_Chr7g0195181 [Rosa chinensis]|uniref:Uncharacterized protein n=1 Tax=Rosa chinensis TaxID=74649 RepID=A0A2P6P6C1_ROSCH|nr:hypothetical protein RchiOBHm_Chr7g0195181 [Rosa chinensis]